MTELYELIHGLTQAEKGYFKKYTQTHSVQGEQRYVQLFEAIEQQVHCDEVALKEAFAKGKSLAYFSTLKRYLYDAILRSLQAYEAQKSKRRRVEDWKREAEWLIRRGLHRQGLKRLKKAQKLAYQLEYFTLLIDILRLENNTIGLYLLDRRAERKAAINAEITRLLQLLERERFYFDVYDRLFTQSRVEQSLRTAEDLETLNEWMQQPLLQEPVEAESLLAKHLFYGAHFTYQTLLGNHEAAYEYSRKCLAVWENRPLLQQECYKEYLALFSNHINRCYHLRKANELQELLRQLQQQEAPNASLQVVTDVRAALHQLSWHELTLNYQHFEQTVAEIEDLLKRMTNTSEKRLLLYNIANQYLVQGAYEQALDFCSKILQLPSSQVQHYLQRFGHLLQLLLHYELANQRLLEYDLRNCYNFFKNQNKLYKFERLFLKMMRQLTAELHQYGTQSTFCDYHQQFAALKQDTYESRAFAYLDILAWLEAKQSKTTMLAVYRKVKK